ncbi:2-dehydro-3-deoxygalactonokinase [Salinarimonas soli]|uniref:2-dehydro-3-deoxygalactonokinase n=1 Tax=Salinarimonas soli TaxID=1638099 RepID=A0A5B2V842_9HYPH|nr:2-dehydro-3-deoxygalactonokinase [Salinarimonas soli]KAA2234986.1 2-dehydro-3-deoxygalactonokinase [Salinarimonas soli]
MRFILVDWGTTRFRGFLVEDGAITGRVSADEGVSALKGGDHPGVFRRHCGPWLEAYPDAPVALVGMVGSREGWTVAPYAPCPAGPADIARALIPVDLGGGRMGRIVPGAVCEVEPGAVDVMRGEETLALGAGVADGLVCLPGTHPKWVEMRGGRIHRFATYLTGEAYDLFRNHSMVGRPATEPEDPAGFDLGLDAAGRNAGEAEPVLRSAGIEAPRARRAGLLHLLFGARAATVTGRLPPAQLGPYLSGLLTGDEINGALSLFPAPEAMTIVAGSPRADLYVRALARRGIEARIKSPEEALIAGLGLILAQG